MLGDIITAIHGTKVRNSSDLYKVLDKSMVRQSYNLLKAVMSPAGRKRFVAAGCLSDHCCSKRVVLS
jgi:hypothetical protein